ncbi:hydrogenase formation protein HypD [Candidatus Dojkabacteria bacterium]|nr:hydrogenase formation protein HypD [Candidatus Dojkabacteria bacterium]
MDYISEYRETKKIENIVEKIKAISTKKVRLMEVCGGHTMVIFRFGIKSLLPDNIELISGPGCPVCVTSRKYIDKAVAYSRLEDVIITTFGDLMKVPGSSSSLGQEKARGADIRIVYSIMDAIKIAREIQSKHNSEKKVVFLGIGFETTAPTSAAGIKIAKKEDLSNFLVYSAHKLMPPAMKALIDEKVKLNGYLAPGHVSTVTGSKIYDFIAKKYNIPVVIAGFEPVDILQSIYLLIKQIEENKFKVQIQYKRAVKPEGNLKAQKLIQEVFEPRDDWWRGLGVLENSGLKIRNKFEEYDAEEQIKVKVEKTVEPKGCICGQILKGVKCPKDCKLFGKVCKPINPVGACMVSSEGACAAYYKYNRV